MAEYPALRRADRALPEAEALALLHSAEWGVLASCGENSLPLATPLSFVVAGGAIYFHCALKGHKLRNLAQNPSVCFCVVGATQPLYDGDFTTLYQSCLVHGTAALVQNEDEKRAILMALCEKYLPAHMGKAAPSIDKSGAVTAVVRITPQKISGKARKMRGG